MDTLRALLWKEGRVAACRVAACACLALLAAWTFSLDPVYHLVGILGAILMSMDLVAGERGRGTLPFQSNLPVRTAWLLGVKFSVGAAGLLAVLAAYWAGVFLGIPHWGSADFLSNPSWQSYEHPLLMEILKDVGYGRILLLWFLFSLIFYSGAFLSSTLSNRPFQAAWTSLLMAFVVVFLVTASRVSYSVSFFWWQVVGLDLDLDGQILRSASDPTLLLARTAVAFLLAGCVLVWTCRAFRTQGRRGFKWIMIALFLTTLVVEHRPRSESNSKTAEYWVQPVGLCAIADSSLAIYRIPQPD